MYKLTIASLVFLLLDEFCTFTSVVSFRSVAAGPVEKKIQHVNHSSVKNTGGGT